MGAFPAGSVSISSSRAACSMRGGGRGRRSAGRAEAVSAHQLRPDRSPEEAAAHQPEGGRRHRQRDGAGEVVLLLHQLAERGAGAVPARHGDGAGDEAEQRIDAEHVGEAHPDGVLQHREERGEPPEDEDLPAADLEQAEAGAESDGGEEGDHERRLQPGVELEGQDAGLPERQGDGGEDEPAHHRGGDVEPVQHADLAPDAVPGKEDERGQRDRLHHVQRHGGGHRRSGVREGKEHA